MEVHITSEQFSSKEWLQQQLDEIQDRLAQLAQLSKAAYQGGDIALAYTYAREGEEWAALGYEYAGRWHDLTQPVEECPEVLEAVEDMLGLA